MRILMILGAFVPEIGSGVQINYDLAKCFVKHGHSVDVITSYPREYKLTDKGNETPLEEIMDGINVYRVKHYYTRDSKVLRGLEHFYIPLYYLRKYKSILRIKEKYDVIFTHIPPLPMYYMGKYISIFNKTPVIINVPDYHPKELVDVGFLKNRLIISILSHIEKQAYKHADYITVQSPGGVAYVLENGGRENSVSYVYNSTNRELIDDILSKRSLFKTKNGIDGKTLVTYAGIFSPFQNIDTIIDTAKLFQENNNIIFYLVGDGTEYTRIANRINNEGIANVKIMPYLPREEYLELMKASDIALVSLDIRMHAPCIPGKMVNLLALGKAVFAIIPSNCETEKLIYNANCGVCVSPDNVTKISQLLNEMIAGDKCLDYGKNGRRFYEENLTSEIASRKYENLMLELISNQK